MSEEMLGGLDVGNVSNSLGEASEQDMIRVSESMQKAAQMGGQIRDDQKKNGFLSQFLTFLFSAVQNDDIRAMAVELFSRPDQNGTNQTLSIYEMTALFLPFYAMKAQELGLDQSFSTLHYMISLSEGNYMSYIAKVAATYPLYQALDKDTLSMLITSLLLYHSIIAIPEGQTYETVSSRIRRAL